VSSYVLKVILKLMHPYCPFITEEIWSHFSGKTLIINSDWPKSNSKLINNNIEDELKLIMSLITSIRNVKASFGISPKKEIFLVCKVNKQKEDIILNYKNYLKRLVKVVNLEIGSDIKKPKKSTTIVLGDVEIYIPLEDLIDIKKEIDRLSNQISNLEGRLNSVDRKLSNEKFASNAPEEIVNHEKNKKDRYEKELLLLQNNLNSLK